MDGFDGEYLWRRLRSFPSAPRYWVAYSGGRDSHVLLHAMAGLRPRLGAELRAIHIDHGLQSAATAWAEHCRRVCAELAVPLVVERVAAAPAAGESPEAAARDARYRAFHALLGAGDCLLLAHHLDDQAETLLLRLLRGAGVHGLAAMPARRPLGRGWLLRPLLDVPRAAITAYAQRHGLAWVEDPSNDWADFDRNYLRRRVMPILAERWPGAARTFARAAAHSAEAVSLLDELAQGDLAACASGEGVDAAALRALTPERQRNLLRYWIRRHGLEPPPRERLLDGLRALLEAGEDRQPELRWPAGHVRRYRGRLLLERDAQVHQPTPIARAWDLRAPIDWAGGRLEAVVTQEGGLRTDLLGRDDITLRPRRGGERLRLPGRAHASVLKKLLQEHAVPPWERQRLPLLYVGERLAAVADLFVDAAFLAPPGEPGLRLVWRRAVGDEP